MQKNDRRDSVRDIGQGTSIFMFPHPSAKKAVQPLDQIAYCCLVSPGALASGLADLVVQANQQGSEPAISGLLMWDGRLMLHWMEGARDALDLMWDQVQNDPRQHCLVPLLHRRGVSKRLFSNWQMQPSSRNEMMSIVREARQLASQPLHHEVEMKAQTESMQHAIGTLSILLNPDLAPLYAQQGRLSDAALSAQDALTVNSVQSQALLASLAPYEAKRA
jgi:hypothetical protein